MPVVGEPTDQVPPFSQLVRPRVEGLSDDVLEKLALMEIRGEIGHDLLTETFLTGNSCHGYYSYVQ
jgi:hypothetical protein